MERKQGTAMASAVRATRRGAPFPRFLTLHFRHCGAPSRAIDDAAQSLGEDPLEWLRQGDAIFRNAIAQPLICISQLAHWALLRSHLPPPAALAGYSVGELACYGVSGALGTAEVVRLAR